MAGAIHAGHLGRLPADECAAALLAAERDGFDNSGSLALVKLARRKVVEEEERLGALVYSMKQSRRKSG